jgi:hypothetical protein
MYSLSVFLEIRTTVSPYSGILSYNLQQQFLISDRPLRLCLQFGINSLLFYLNSKVTGKQAGDSWC